MLSGGQGPSGFLKQKALQGLHQGYANSCAEGEGMPDGMNYLSKIARQALFGALVGVN